MAVKIKFDTSGMPESPTFVLSKRSGTHIGVLNNISQLQVRDNMNSPFEFSMIINKFLNEENVIYGMK